MNVAVIYLRNASEENLASMDYLGGNLLENLVEKLKETSVSRVYLVGSEKEIPGTYLKGSIEEILEEQDQKGKTLLISPFYPFLKSYFFEAILKNVHEGTVLSVEKSPLRVYAFQNEHADDYLNLDYHPYNIDLEAAREIKDIETLRAFEREERKRINIRHLKNGVNIIDADNTYISEKAKIERGATLYPNVIIEGKSILRKKCVITSGSFLKDCEIGEECEIISSRIEASIVHKKVKIGPYASLCKKTEVFDGARIGSFVELENVRFGKESKCARLTYLGDCVVGEKVNIGCGVVTVNVDKGQRFATIIEDNASVGSNTTLIAPLTVGSKEEIQSGATVRDEKQGGVHMTSRIRQTEKEGYGF